MIGFVHSNTTTKWRLDYCIAGQLLKFSCKAQGDLSETYLKYDILAD